MGMHQVAISKRDTMQMPWNGRLKCYVPQNDGRLGPVILMPLARGSVAPLCKKLAKKFVASVAIT